MLINCQSFSVRVLSLILRHVDAGSTDKLLSIKGPLEQAATALINGDEVDNNYLRIRNDEGIPYTTGALLLSGTFENAGTAGS